MNKDLAERITNNKSMSRDEYEKYATSPVTDAVLEAVNGIRAIEKKANLEAACHMVEAPQETKAIFVPKDIDTVQKFEMRETMVYNAAKDAMSYLVERFGDALTVRLARDIVDQMSNDINSAVRCVPMTTVISSQPTKP